MPLRFPIALLLLCSVACAAFGNAAHDRLQAMGEAGRAAALAGVIQSNGERCSAVTLTFLQGMDRRGNALWNARCTSGEAYVVQVNNDPSGSTSVTNCKVALAMNAGPCFVRRR